MSLTFNLPISVFLILHLTGLSFVLILLGVHKVLELLVLIIDRVPQQLVNDHVLALDRSHLPIVLLVMHQRLVHFAGGVVVRVLCDKHS